VTDEQKKQIIESYNELNQLVRDIGALHLAARVRGDKLLGVEMFQRVELAISHAEAVTEQHIEWTT
jgi:hypothetical protein